MRKKDLRPTTIRIVVGPHLIDPSGGVYDFSFGIPTDKDAVVDTETEVSGIDSLYLFTSLRGAIMSALDEVHPAALVMVLKAGNSERKAILFRTVALGVAKQKKSKTGKPYVITPVDLNFNAIASEGHAVILSERGVNIEDYI